MWLLSEGDGDDSIHSNGANNRQTASQSTAQLTTISNPEHCLNNCESHVECDVRKGAIQIGTMSAMRRRHPPPFRRHKRSFKYVCLALITVAFIYNFMLLKYLEDDKGRWTIPYNRQPVAYLNNVPLFLREFNNDQTSNQRVGVFDHNFHSTVHCIGETHNEKTSWKHKSCSYVHLCLDFPSASTINHNKPSVPEFFVVNSSFEKEYGNRFRQNSKGLEGHGADFFSSTNLENADVALGAIMPEWGRSSDKPMPYTSGVNNVRWSPNVYDSMPSRYFYELEENVVMVPFHAVGAANVGHLLWDNLLPIYNLLRMFGLDKNARATSDYDVTGSSKGYQHLLLRVDTIPKLFATCDLRPKKKEACKRNFDRFLPLFGVDPETFTPLSEVKLTRSKSVNGSPTPSTPVPVYPVCSKHAVVGMGWLGDHGTSIGDHGWWMDNDKYSLDLALSRNIGRGPELYAFRNFLLENMGFDPDPSKKYDPRSPITFRILLSCHSSQYRDRDFGMEEQYKALKESFPGTVITRVTLKDIPLDKQLELVSQPTQTNEHIVFVSANGGGTATSFFLPRGSSMILYFNEHGGKYANDTNSGGKALLDWDLMDNIGYVRTNWLPIGNMNDADGLNALIDLIRHEMDVTMNGFFR